MLEVYAAAYIDIGMAIQSIAQNLSASLAPDEKLNQTDLQLLNNTLGLILKLAMEINLPVFLNILGSLLGTYNRTTPSYDQVKTDALSLHNIIRAELDARLFFFVPPGRSRYYSVPPNPELAFPLFGRAEDGLAEQLEPFRPVLIAFRSIEHDLREAGNCYALERFTACVFHLMRVMETGLKVTANAIGVSYSSNWGHCLAEIEKKGQGFDPFFTEAVAYLRSVKNAWRNPTMHIERSYSEQDAEQIFNAVRAFMRHLAGRLAE